MNHPRPNKMVRVGILGLISNASLTVYFMWLLHYTHDEGYRSLGLMFALGAATWTIGLMIMNALSEQDK